MKLSTKQLTLYGVMAALTCVVTMFLSIPSFNTGGYLNLGDGVIMLTSFLFGPWAGACVGSIGSALADLLKGYVVYAPITFVVKGLEGLFAGLIYVNLRKTNMARALAGCIAGAWMAIGYAAAETFMYGFAGAIKEIPSNLAQGWVGALIAFILTIPLARMLKTEK